MAPQSISVTVEQDAAVVTLRGEHEAFTADKLARHVAALLSEGVSVIVDLREASFIDSTVVGVLLAGRRRAEAAGLRFVLLLGADTGWPVRRLLEVTGLDAQFDVGGRP
jgi:anti-sigma B factor antagonist